MLIILLTYVNFRKLCRIACIFLFLVFLSGEAHAATIHGTVYEWNSFKPLNNTVVEVNSTPEQYVVAKDANYSFNLTPGTYSITAYYLEGKKVVYKVKEEVVISDKGEYVHDLLLFPTYDEELLNPEEFQGVDINLDDETQPSSRVDSLGSQNYFIVSVFLAFIVLLLIGYLLKKRNEKPPEIITGFPGGNGYPEGNSFPRRNHFPVINNFPEGNVSSRRSGFPEEDGLSERNSFPEGNVSPRRNEEPKALQPGNPIKEADYSEESENDSADSLDECFEISPRLNAPVSVESGDSQEDRESSLPEDLKELLDLIRNNGNRITQRELRKKSPYSESKVSLMLSDLEERGLIEKFKKGRGNIIRIPDEHVSRQIEDESGKNNVEEVSDTVTSDSASFEKK
jgi:uncharacterized membrane protein